MNRRRLSAVWILRRTFRLPDAERVPSCIDRTIQSCRRGWIQHRPRSMYDSHGLALVDPQLRRECHNALRRCAKRNELLRRRDPASLQFANHFFG